MQGDISTELMTKNDQIDNFFMNRKTEFKEEEKERGIQNMFISKSLKIDQRTIKSSVTKTEYSIKSN